MFIPLCLSLRLYLWYRGLSAVCPKIWTRRAIVDGCTPWQLFIRVMLPPLKPIIVTLFITQFVFVWERFSDAVIFDQELRKLDACSGAYNFMGQFLVSGIMVCAYILVCTLPAVLIYILGQNILSMVWWLEQ